MDLDLRKLRYFAAVAEHLHFGRAAEQLYIAQPVLSRQIRALEQELGCALLVRTTRTVALTPAGEQLREEARGVFATVDSAVRRVLEIDRGVERLVVAFTAVHPDVEIKLLTANWWEQDAALRDGRADVGLLRRPFDDAGLRTIPIGTEGEVACMPVTHPLARRRTLLRSDLNGSTFLDVPSRRTSPEEKFELIAAGHGIAVLPHSIGESYPRPDLVYVPLTDVPHAEICVAVMADRREQRVLDFVAIATEVARPKPVRLAAVD
jgi:DNA-binding transcriptional LysR family regulator